MTAARGHFRASSFCYSLSPKVAIHCFKIHRSSCQTPPCEQRLSKTHQRASKRGSAEIESSLLSRVQMHWICPLCKLSTCWAQQVERIWTPCWEVLSGDESCWFKFETGQTFSSTPLNILLVSRSSMRGSTKSSAFAQQRSTCWAPRTRSAQRIQRFSWSTWAFVKSSDCSTCQSLLRSFEHRAQQHLKKHSTC